MHAFFKAAFEGNRDHIRECIKKEVDINATNECGSTALILSSEKGQMVLCGKFDAFHDRPVQYSQQQQKAISRMLRDLLTKGSIDLNLKDKELNTALMWAVYHRRIQDVRALLQAEADPNIQKQMEKRVF